VLTQHSVCTVSLSELHSLPSLHYFLLHFSTLALVKGIKNRKIPLYVFFQFPIYFFSPKSENSFPSALLQIIKICFCSTGFWHRVDSSVDASIPEKHIVSIFSLENSVFIRNGGICRQVYTAPKPKRTSSSSSPP
jgi:hypothetical protein